MITALRFLNKGAEEKFARTSEMWTDSTGEQDPWVRYAIRWGEAMQTLIDGGFSVTDAADRTENECDTELINGKQFAYAVKALIFWWRYGNDLNKWALERKVFG